MLGISGISPSAQGKSAQELLGYGGGGGGAR